MGATVATVKVSEMKGFGDISPERLSDIAKEMEKRLKKRKIVAKVTADSAAGGKAVKFTCKGKQDVDGNVLKEVARTK